jgi:hypothetical protein
MISNTHTHTHTHTHTETRCLACFEGEIEILTLMSAKKELIDQKMTTTTNFYNNVTAIEQSSSPVMIVTTQATTTTQTQITNNLHLKIQKKRNRSYYQKKLDIISGYNADVIWKAESVRFEQDSSCVFKRFCQKCTRFEDLHLFDGQKRACKASLEELASKRRGNYK